MISDLVGATVEQIKEPKGTTGRIRAIYFIPPTYPPQQWATPEGVWLLVQTDEGRLYNWHSTTIVVRPI